MEIPGIIEFDTKGDLMGRCNLTRCTSGQPATWYNHGSLKHYCKACAQMLNADEFNKRDAMRMFDHDLCTEVVHIIDGAEFEATMENMKKELDNFVPTDQTVVIDSLSSVQTRHLYKVDEMDRYYNRLPEPAVSTKIPRNNPCPCNSGRKYKQCCLLK